MSCAFYGLHFCKPSKDQYAEQLQYKKDKQRFMQRTLLPLNRHLSYLVQAESRPSLQNSTDYKWCCVTDYKFQVPELHYFQF